MKKTCWRSALLGGSLLAAASLLTVSHAQASCSTDSYIGSICTTAASYCPVDTMEAAGQALQISEYTALYSLLGTQYGGNGTTVFNLPDMRGRSTVGAGQGRGLTNVPQGAMRGTETVTLTTRQLPAHSHALMAVDEDGSVKVQQGAWLANPLAEARGRDIEATGYAPSTSSSSRVTLNRESVGETGHNRPISTVPPQISLRHCITVNGVYPPRP
ncbi:phage tail protein [Vreelandella gomseomensis]|uniref:Tail fiber protein n=1 Tax=Vreelandella gomseomensis TaxID=370766 RepID=A0ABU1GGF0_9GAMM|nr:tail fiber protein [Halomonas gomseomensis]MDR5876562.1 tail fiber protein [Halomonas gomseomensis]